MFSQGEPGHACYWVRAGLLKGSVDTAEGEPFVVAIHGPGDLIGDIAAIDGQHQVTTVEAIFLCELTMIDYSSFRSAQQQYAEFSRWLTLTLARRIRDVHLDQAASTRRAPSRVAYALLKVMQLVGEPLDDLRIGVPFLLSHDFLASIAGVSRESASRAIGDLRKQGIIDRSNAFPMVIQKQWLERERAP